MKLYLNQSAMLRHEVVFGKSGSGKSEYVLWRLSQQIKQGGGALVVDAKADRTFRDTLWNLVRALGRSSVLRCVNIDDPIASHTYNPLLQGDPAAVASRFTETIDVGRNATAEHFRMQGNLAMIAVLTALKSLRMPYNAADLYVLLTNPAAMEWLPGEVTEPVARAAYLAWLDGFRQREGRTMRINLSVMRQQIGGAISRLYMLGTGDVGRVTGAYAPDVDLLDSITHAHVIYVMLPTLDKSESAIAFAKLLFGDLRSAIATLYTRPLHHRPERPFLVVLDEFGAYANRLAASAFEMARGARIALMPIVQTHANLRNVSEEFADQVIGNAETATFFSTGDRATAEYAAALFGQDRRVLKGATRTWGSTSGNRNLHLSLLHPVGHSESVAESLREIYDFRVRPEEFAGLEPGQALVRIKSADEIVRVRIPMIRPPHSVGFRHRPLSTRQAAGLDLLGRFGAVAT